MRGVPLYARSFHVEKCVSERGKAAGNTLTLSHTHSLTLSLSHSPTLPLAYALGPYIPHTVSHSLTRGGR